MIYFIGTIIFLFCLIKLIELYHDELVSILLFLGFVAIQLFILYLIVKAVQFFWYL